MDAKIAELEQQVDELTKLVARLAEAVAKLREARSLTFDEWKLRKEGTA